MWWHCRWATGSPIARWGSTAELFRECYPDGDPLREFQDAAERALALLDKLDCRATFFVLGEVAELLPDVVRRISEAGHEIASHGWRHVDASTLPREEFVSGTRRAKALVEDLIGDEVAGYRAPNLVLSPWLLEEIHSAGFLYDSSICPSRPFGGKYHGQSRYPNHPFCLPLYGELETSGARLVEIPVTTMPFLRLPACSSIITRLFGLWWTRLAMRLALRRGPVLYYFHPYELADPPGIREPSAHMRRFFRNMGHPFGDMIESLLAEARETGTILARDLAREMLEDANAGSSTP